MAYQQGDADPYAPGQRTLDPESPALAAVIATALHQHALALRVAMPASVARVRGNQMVDLQPLLQGRYVDGTVAAPPVIPNALVCSPLGQQWGVKLPLAVGDLGVALFADRNMDTWTAGNGGAADPQDDRAHNLTDAFFLPGLATSAGQTQDKTTDLTVRNGQATLKLHANGTFTVTNGTQELVSLVTQVASSLASLCNLLATQALTLTALGPQPFIASTLAALQQQQQQVQTLVNNLQTLKAT